MIANDKESPLEVAVKMITAPVWVPIYFAWVGCRKVVKAWPRRKPKPIKQEILPPATTAWMPKTESERTVYAALILAGEPVNNLKLAALMGVSPGEVLTTGRPARGRDPQGPQGSRGFD